MSYSLLEFFKEQEIEYAEQFDISSVSYIKIGGAAAYAAMPNTTEKIIKLVDFLNLKGINYKIAGGLSNILPSDEDYPGVLILTTKCDRYYVAENILSVECGARLTKVIRAVAMSGFGGMESLSGIPGTLGGMMRSNAGAYGHSISDFLVCASIYSPETKRVFTLDVGNMNMSYRHSCFVGTNLIILSAKLRVYNDDSAVILAKISELTKKRQESQPYNMPSLGSVFKRCGDIPISLLIDRLGLKGLTVGGAQVSKKHAGFIVNAGGATAKDVRTLIALLKEKIYSAYGIVPEEEIEII